MKINIEKDALLKALQQIQSVVDSRATIPVLENVLIETDGDNVMLRATDLDLEVINRVAAMIEVAGATTVSAKTLLEITRKLPPGSLVTLSTDDVSGRLEVVAGRSNFKLATLPKEDFPEIATSEFTAEFEASATDLNHVFGKSQFAISNEETRYYLNGVFLHASDTDYGKVLRCVATDGHRLARIDVELPDGAEDIPGVIVPRKTVTELLRVVENTEQKIKVYISETKIRFVSENIILTSKVIDGNFPDYNRVIPVQNNRRMEVNQGELYNAVDRVSSISSDRSSAVKFSVGNDALFLSVNALEKGMAEETVQVSYSDEPIEIGFNWKYILEIVKQIDRDNVVFLFNTSANPALLQEGNDKSSLYVVMPMRY
ncbi:MAG: DNA polymerase III subunit beta [Roseovarius sp.]|nr:DNA polymerase III subunit beta [Roseovarius sp.]MCY4290342.1 DNA polymerase III subunit beta [Roseovarius sp.]MCY4316859.1 DNA polymerase III subunit beta [Roseovarius sp.]